MEDRSNDNNLIIYPDDRRHERFVAAWVKAGNPTRFTVEGVSFLAIRDGDILKFVCEQKTEAQNTKFSTASSLRGLIG